MAAFGDWTQLSSRAARGRLRPVSPRPQSSRSSFWTERTDFAFVQRDAFPYRLYSPRSMVASPSQNRLWADTYPALRTPAGPAPRPQGHSLAILFRFFFDPLPTRPGTGQGEWRGLGAGRDRGMYQINGRPGVVRLSRQRRNDREVSNRSGGRSRRCPRAIGFGSKEAKGRSADQVSLHVEVVVDGGVSREEPLR